ncbi:MAG: Rieske (2Fe-2S) protein [Planctomycetes bacterium]|nr:Rieske (2Fe-2S) protein [Planctomycetota bacterium]
MAVDRDPAPARPEVPSGNHPIAKSPIHPIEGPPSPRPGTGSSPANPTWVRLAAVADLAAVAPGSCRELRVADRVIALVNDAGTLRALDAVCPHRHGLLSGGRVANGVLACPQHGWPFDVTTGACVDNPAIRVRLYPVKIEAGELLIEL